jgi:predicted Zn-dependent protease
LNRNSEESLKSADVLARRAVDLDPGFGMGWSLLADVNVVSAENLFLPPAQAFERARTFAKKSLELSPNLSGPHSVLVNLHLDYDWDWTSSKAEAAQALAKAPSDSYALNAAGRVAATLGRWDEAEDKLRTALVRDPRNPFPLFNLAHTYYRAGRFADSESAFRKLLALQPDFAWTRGYFAKTLVMQGKSAEALEMAELESDVSARLTALAVALQATGRKADANKPLQALRDERSDTAAFYVALIYAYRGENDRALEWLERAYRQKDVGLVEIVGEHMFDGLSGDSRYNAFLRKMNLPETTPRASP